MEAKYVTIKELPESATLVGKLGYQEGVPVDTSTQSAADVRDKEVAWVRNDLIRQAGEKYAVDGQSLYLIETKALASLDVWVDFQADVYRV